MGTLSEALDPDFRIRQGKETTDSQEGVERRESEDAGQPKEKTPNQESRMLGPREELQTRSEGRFGILSSRCPRNESHK
ncbi:hypothetical protein NDU88_002663 [Pleurodeles waltl]|uniref:Uncharacterized protein n=1 Tax=Pleurodeles waltl TaxID=8319 RepID=A0AAV7WP67_PLEWA|nr:hypothetical protein NDU88_002663 [Pleurodeles waltl]